MSKIMFFPELYYFIITRNFLELFAFQRKQTYIHYKIHKMHTKDKHCKFFQWIQQKQMPKSWKTVEATRYHWKHWVYIEASAGYIAQLIQLFCQDRPRCCWPFCFSPYSLLPSPLPPAQMDGWRRTAASSSCLRKLVFPGRGPYMLVSR